MGPLRMTRTIVTSLLCVAAGAYIGAAWALRALPDLRTNLEPRP